MALDAVRWKELSPAVQLAIVSQLSDQHPMTKVYDMLGLYAQDVGDVKRIAARYNRQREVEDNLISWMQQDQLSGILRTDHTLTVRGAADAYQHFQTQSYMKKIEAEIDESLLQATRAEVDLGKRFLAQQGIRRNMVGCWEHISGYTHMACHCDHEMHIPRQPVLVRSGLDSGYVSSTISPDQTSTRNEADVAFASRPRTVTRTSQQTEVKQASRPRDTKKLEFQQPAAPLEGHQAQQHNPPCPHCYPPDWAEEASVAGSSGRSRRSIRRSSRYDEAIAELKLRGSCGELDSDYEMTDESDRDIEKSEDPHAPIPSPRLHITFNKRTVNVPMTLSNPIVTHEASNIEVQKSPNVPRIPPLDARGAHATTPKRVASPMPLQRVVVRPPKTMPKPKQSNTTAEPSKGLTKNERNQKLFSVPREANEFTSSLLKASERNAANATPWIPPQPKYTVEPALPVIVDQRKRSDTVTAPSFSPIAEDFPSLSSQEYQQKNTTLQSSSETVRSHRTDRFTDAALVKSSFAQTPDFASTPTSELYHSTCNDRFIVSESGSPMPCRRKPANNVLAPAANGVIKNNQGVAAMRHENPSSPRPATKIPQQASSTRNVCRSLDPITGNVVNQSPPKHDPPTTSPTHKLPPQVSSNTPPKPLVALHEAGEEIQKAAADLKNAATEITRSTIPTKKDAAMPNSAAKPPNTQSDSPAPMAGGLKQKRRYVKSEAQRRKEAERKEKRERDQTERDAKVVVVKGK
jgi:hypothetical protein